MYRSTVVRICAIKMSLILIKGYSNSFKKSGSTVENCQLARTIARRREHSCWRRRPDGKGL